MKKICMAAMTMLVITGCSDKTTTNESKQEENTVQQHSQHDKKANEQDVKKQPIDTQQNLDFLKHHEGYWQAENEVTFVEIKVIQDKPLYIIHKQDGTKKEFLLELTTTNKEEKQIKGTITPNEKATGTMYQSINIRNVDQDKLIIDTEDNPVTFIKSDKEAYDKIVQNNKQQTNSEIPKQESLDQTLQLLNGTWKSNDNAQELTISVENANTGTFQWEGQEPVVFVINENRDGKVSIVYESVASPSHNMIEWRWAPSDKELVWDNFLGDTSTYERIE
ncbi:hypothetical protein [Priestia megaterium]|uniref:hypothetical protein n=1 Tax=Priestia megaterium TaxID=1404 RepID=UPI0038796172